MKKHLLSLLDKIAVAFLYLNVLVPTVAPGGIPLSKAAFVGMLAVFVAILTAGDERLRLRSLSYIILSLGGMALLVGTSLLLGNELESILGLSSIVLFVLIIPPLTLLFAHFGAQRYIRHLTQAIICLALIFVTLVVLTGSFNLREIATYVELSETTFSDTLRFAFFPGGVRITTTNQGFFSVGLVLAYARVLKSGRWRDILAFALVGIALHFCYTMSLWVSAVLGLTACILLPRPQSLHSPDRHASLGAHPLRMNRTDWRKLVTILAGVAAISFTLLKLPAFIIESKGESFNFKHLQLLEALDTFSSSPLVGKGLGFVYHQGEYQFVSGSASTLLENSYAVILSSTGLLGAAVFAFIYLYYPVFLLRSSKSWWMLVLLIAHLMVLVQAWGNPFLWSGGIGLLFACFLGASLEHAASQRTRAHQFVVTTARSVPTVPPFS